MQNRFIDLYSDTKTKPSPGMRKAMAEAEVGDEQKYEDPTTNRLREKLCEILGKEDSVFMPSGTMCNQAAIRVHCRLGDEVIADKTAHIINAETGGTAANSGVMIRMAIYALAMLAMLLVQMRLLAHKGVPFRGAYAALPLAAAPLLIHLLPRIP